MSDRQDAELQRVSCKARRFSFVKKSCLGMQHRGKPRCAFRDGVENASKSGSSLDENELELHKRYTIIPATELLLAAAASMRPAPVSG